MGAHVQLPLIAISALCRSASCSYVNGRGAGGSHRSVQPSASVTVRSAHSQMYSRSPPRRRSNRIRSRRFVRGWNGWVTTIESESVLDDRALCADRRNAKLSHSSVRLGYFNTPYRLRPIAAIKQLPAQFRFVTREVFGQFLNCHAVYSGRALVRSYLLQRFP